jgi:Trk K+ transport system NAD-binding subunit
LGIGMALAALAFQMVYNRSGDVSGTLTYVQAVLAVIRMLQLDVDVPASPRLDPFFVLVPLIGWPFFFFLGVNVINVIRVFVMRAERGQAWQTTLASTYVNHILVCGLGRVGYRLADQLLTLGVPVVGINDVSSPLVKELIDRGVPVILGDARNEEMLKQGGVERARAAVICTDQDLVNIEAAFYVQTLNPEARIVLRFFEDEIVDEIRASFDVDAVISRSAIAAVSFAHAALGIEVVETFQLADTTYLLARLPLDEASPFLGKTIAQVNEAQDVTIVFQRSAEGLDLEPDSSAVLSSGDDLFVFVPADRLQGLMQAGFFDGETTPEGRPIFVCGLGHTGYRVVRRLVALGQPVIAMAFESGALARRLSADGVPVVVGDFHQRAFLLHHGIEDAAALVACTEDDMVNLETVLRARGLNPNLRLVLRLFEEGLGEHLRQSFGIHAVYSTSAIANPAFLSAALRMHVAQRVEVGEGRLFVARLKVQTLSALVSNSIAELNAEEGLTAVLHARKNVVSIPPVLRTRLRVDDELVVLASQEKLQDLLRRNRSLRETRRCT